MMRYSIYMSIRGDHNARYIREIWADSFTYSQSVMAKRVAEDRRITSCEGTVSDIELLVQNVRRLGSALLDFRMGVVSE